MNTRFKVFASYIILQYLCDFIHVLVFVTVSKCQKSLKLTNIVITSQIENVSDQDLKTWYEIWPTKAKLQSLDQLLYSWNKQCCCCLHYMLLESYLQ